MDRVDALKKTWRACRARLPEIALRFCLSNPAVSTVIPGMRKVRNVESNCACSGSGPLPAAVLSTLKKHAWPKNFYS